VRMNYALYCISFHAPPLVVDQRCIQLLEAAGEGEGPEVIHPALIHPVV
jgi:hypothetical protein